ncbi:MAG: hypothetical protein MUO52_08990, partial [Desulfobacterales bacterium]|nr:hypothetical protein [Desulfobacterales bacterium]
PTIPTTFTWKFLSFLSKNGFAMLQGHRRCETEQTWIADKFMPCAKTDLLLIGAARWTLRPHAAGRRLTGRHPQDVKPESPDSGRPA